jgi:prophage regulatory protein
MADANQPRYSILRRKQVEVRTGLSRSTIYTRTKAGTFPAPISLGPRAVGWIEGDVQRWISDRIKSGWSGNSRRQERSRA